LLAYAKPGGSEKRRGKEKRTLRVPNIPITMIVFVKQEKHATEGKSKREYNGRE
jgi:hypothetical protein